MNHQFSQPQRRVLSHPLEKQDVKRQKSFRSRGFSFSRKAGTNRNRMTLRYMWKQPRDWMRLVSSSVLGHIPALAPRPEPAARVENFRYTVPNVNPDDFSFILVGDTGMNSPGQYLVSTALSRQDLYPSDFCLILGDVMYPTGGEEGYQYGLLEAFRYYRKPILALPGNHDWYDRLRAFRQFFVRGGNPGPMAEQYKWQHPQLPNWFYYMDFGRHLRVICLDTGSAGRLRENREQQLAWLDQLLETAKERTVLIMMHHPIYSLRERGHERRLRALIEPRLKKANVAAIFSGHDHNYQRHVVDGRQHVIHGSGGATLHRLPTHRVIWRKNRLPLILRRQPQWDQCFSFLHCRWHNGRLTCTSVSAHELPGKTLDRFVL